MWFMTPSQPTTPEPPPTPEPAAPEPRAFSTIQNTKYLLTVSAGPSPDESTHVPVVVNSSTPVRFSNDFLHCAVQVRIRDYHGLPLASPTTSPYFAHASRARERYSIGFSFVPKVDIPGDVATWGNDFDHPVRDRLPPGFGLAVRIVKEFVDPTIELDAYADEPWLYAPALTSFFAMRIGEKKGAEEWDAGSLPVVSEEEPLLEGADGSGIQLREQLNLPISPTKRRKHYRSSSNRESFTFEAGRLYQADFFNPYIDFGNYSLRLPGISINCLRYINDKTHKLRYVFKNRDTGDVYMCVILTLLHGDDLAVALENEAVAVGEGTGTRGPVNGVEEVYLESKM